MEISDSSDESINESYLSTSSFNDFVNARNEVDPLGDGVNEYTTEEEDSEFDSEEEDHDKEWQQIRERSPVVNEYSEEEEFLIKNIDCNDPFSLYKLFFTDYILEMIVEETNKYALQCINNSSSNNSRRHQQAWQPVTKSEMDTFIGILLIMGVTQLPDIKLYWSKNDMYTNVRVKNAMKRDRFLSILKFLHFSDNTTARTEDRLNKIRNIVEAIVDTFKNAVKPGKNIVIDESMVSWRRFGFRQYIPGKRHKYGIKLYKLCFPEGYTYNIDIYAGKNTKTIEKTHSHDVVMRLLSGLLFEGRTLFIDSYYTSVPLAEELLQKKTFICGTVKVNKTFLPPQAKRKQKRGDIMSFENRSGVKFLKWTDKRSVCMLTTSNNHMCTVIQGTNYKIEPDAVFFYNNAKKDVDLSDQMASYYSCIQKTVKWYRKIIIQLICGNCLVNAWYIHRRWGNKHINIIKFREKIIDHLLTNNHHIEEMDVEKQTPSKKGPHFLESFKGSARKSRKRCKECYKCLYKKKGRDYATKKTKRVMTYCNRCEGQPALCLKCFQKLHRNT